MSHRAGNKISKLHTVVARWINARCRNERRGAHPRVDHVADGVIEGVSPRSGDL